jgi:hypothetical protein
MFSGERREALLFLPIMARRRPVEFDWMPNFGNLQINLVILDVYVHSALKNQLFELLLSFEEVFKLVHEDKIPVF